MRIVPDMGGTIRRKPLVSSDGMTRDPSLSNLLGLGAAAEVNGLWTWLNMPAWGQNPISPRFWILAPPAD